MLAPGMLAFLARAMASRRVAFWAGSLLSRAAMEMSRAS